MPRNMTYQSALDLLRVSKDRFKAEQSPNAEFMKKAAKTENEIIMLLEITEKNDSFSDQEIEDLTVISEHISKLTRLSIFINERKHDYGKCLSIYLNHAQIQKHLFPWIKRSYKELVT